MNGGFLSELKRRNVIRVALLYLAGAWLLVQVAGTLLPMFEAPAWVARAVVILLAIGFLPMLILSWVFEITPEGLKRESEVDRSQPAAETSARRMEHLIVVVLMLALGYFTFDKFVLAPLREVATQQQTEAKVAEARQQGGAEALIKSYGDKSIAVLPFVNMSADKDQEFFADGISEELLNLLAKSPQLRVIARTSSFSFKGKDIEIAEIARRLHVAHVLEGSLRKSGNKVRITAQLIRAADSSHLWSETYDRDLDDIFAVQDEISAAVVAQLKLKMLGGAPKARVTDPKAYALFLQARQLSHQHTTESSTQAVALFQQALAIDPAYPAAWIELGTVYVTQADAGLRPISEGYSLGREAVNKGLALDPDFAPAHAALGYIAMAYDGDLAAAADHLTRALVLAPENDYVLNLAAALAASLGRLESVVAMGEAMTARNPASAGAHFVLGLGYLEAGRPDAAMASLRTTLALSPGYAVAHEGIGLALLAKGQPQAALAEMQAEPNENFRMIGLPIALHALGKKAEADAALAELIRRYENESAYNIAYVYAYRGEADRALEWLDKAVANHDVGLTGIPTEPLFANIRKDRRWLPFLRKLGKAPEQLAAIRFEVTLPGIPAGTSAPTP